MTFATVFERADSSGCGIRDSTSMHSVGDVGLITAEQFIAAVAGQCDGYLLAGKARKVIGRNKSTYRQKARRRCQKFLEDRPSRSGETSCSCNETPNTSALKRASSTSE